MRKPRFSRSLLRALFRRLQSEFYTKQSVGAFISEDAVPSFITSNAFIARCYAKVILSFLCDEVCAGRLDVTKPVYVIELGSGSGKFGFLLLKALLEKIRISRVPASSLKFVMTDFVAANLDTYEKIPNLQRFVTSGHLDFAVFDALSSDGLELRHSKTVLRAGNTVNPLIVLANYVFDTLPQDVYQFRGNTMFEGRITTGTNLTSTTALDEEERCKALLSNMDNLWSYQPLDPEMPVFPGADDHSVRMCCLLEWYRKHYAAMEPDSVPAASSDSGAPYIATTSAFLLFPTATLALMEKLRALSSNRFLLLSADKGFSHPDSFRGIGDPHLAIHRSFSMMVNFHALRLWATLVGGMSLHTRHEASNLKVCCLVVDPHPKCAAPMGAPCLGHDALLEGTCDCGYRRATSVREEVVVDDFPPTAEVIRNPTDPAAFPLLCEAFEELECFGPSEFFQIHRTISLCANDEDGVETPKKRLKSAIALCKLSDWDPDVFLSVRNVFLREANRLKGPLLDEVLRGLHRIVENCFSLGDPDADVPFDVGRMFYALRQYDEALRLYVLSWKTSGPHCITCHNIGLCQYALGQLESAVGWFDKAIQINSEYVKARQWKQKVQLELARAALGESTSRLVIEPSDDSGTRFQLRFNGGTVLL